jgi:hypothetical protein
MEEGSLKPVEQFGIGHLGGRRNLILGADFRNVAVALAVGAEVLDHPFETRNLLGLDFLIKLPPTVHGGAAGDPVGPDEPLGPDVGRLRVARRVAVGADHLAVLAVRLVVLGKAEVLVENAPSM